MVVVFIVIIGVLTITICALCCWVLRRSDRGMVSLKMAIEGIGNDESKHHGREGIPECEMKNTEMTSM